MRTRSRSDPADVVAGRFGSPATPLGGRLAHCARRPPPWVRVVEAGALLAAPVVCWWALRLRAMAAAGLPDPAMHSVYLWDPRDLVVRYAPRVLGAATRAYVGPPAAYFRWGTRPGFLVPGRLAYLAFGAVPGFFVLRYALALVAVVPAYLLAVRVWGRWAGALAVVLVMSSPVLVTAWGTDFPDSAAVSYLLGGTALLAVPARSAQERRLLLAGAGVLCSCAVWSLATTVLLVAAVLLVWGVCRAVGSRRCLPGDLAVLAGAAGATTVALAGGSWALLGRFDFVLPTIRASRFLATPAQEALWHSPDPRWAPCDAYLLVLPATALAWAATRHRPPGGAARPPTVVVGVSFVAQVVVATGLQFLGPLQLLEEHYLSSSLWAAATLTQLVVLAEVARPLADRPRLAFLPAALVAAVALVSEAAPTPPPLGWVPWGFVLVAVVVAAAGAAPRVTGRARSAAVAATIAVAGAVLVLTVAPAPPHPALPGTVYDPPTGYDEALGGRAGSLIDDYRIEHAARRWVPDATSRGEQLVTCVTDPRSTLDADVTALFHASVNLLPGACPGIDAEAVRTVIRREAAQILVVSTHPVDVASTLRRLQPLHAVVARRAHLRAGPVSCWLWLIEVPQHPSTFLRRPMAPSPAGPGR